MLGPPGILARLLTKQLQFYSGYCVFIKSKRSENSGKVVGKNSLILKNKTKKSDFVLSDALKHSESRCVHLSESSYWFGCFVQHLDCKKIKRNLKIGLLHYHISLIRCHNLIGIFNNCIWGYIFFYLLQ